MEYQKAYRFHTDKSLSTEQMNRLAYYLKDRCRNSRIEDNCVYLILSRLHSEDFVPRFKKYLQENGIRVFVKMTPEGLRMRDLEPRLVYNREKLSMRFGFPVVKPSPNVAGRRVMGLRRHRRPHFQL